MKKNRATSLPATREDGILVQELSDEVLVYDLRRHKAHCLNRTAAIIWRHCDGRRTAAEVATLTGRELKTRVDEGVIWHALEQLEKAGLLEDRVALPKQMEGLSRRQMMKRLGAGAVIALPLITSIIAPTAAQAASNLPNGTPCTASSQCASRCCRKTDLICRPVGQGACL
ncbi:MAG TPA: PqqD family protein [Blastocatellia bacterium]|nr:PqqD family protein [Blastocatellia bacterium]